MDKFWENYIKTRPADSKGAFEAFKKMSQEPRTMDLAEGGRIGFGDGGITLVKNLSKNVVGENLRLFNQGKLYHLRIGADKKNYYGSKEKLTKIFNKRRTAGGDVMSRLEKAPKPEGWLTKKQFLKFLKENSGSSIDISLASKILKEKLQK